MKTLMEIWGELANNDVTKFDHKQMYKFIKKKKVLFIAFKAYKKIFPKKDCSRRACRAVYNRYILDDPNLEKAYKSMFKNVSIK